MSRYHILIHSSQILLSLHSDPFVAKLLEDCMPDTYGITNAQFPNYQKEFPITKVRPEDYVQWKWARPRTFEKAPPELITDDVIKLSALARSRGMAFFRILRNIENTRYSMGNGLYLQETIYVTKRLQAQALRDSGYDESRMLEFPFVLHYADLKKISMKEAADEILFRARLAEERLSRTEVLRLKYFDLVRTADAGEIDGIIENFLFDCNVHQLM